MRTTKILYSGDLWNSIDERREKLGINVSDFCRSARISRVAYYKQRNGGGIHPQTKRQLENLLDRLERRLESS